VSCRRPYQKHWANWRRPPQARHFDGYSAQHCTRPPGVHKYLCTKSTTQSHNPPCTARQSGRAVPAVHCWLNHAEIRSKKASMTCKRPPLPQKDKSLQRHLYGASWQLSFGTIKAASCGLSWPRWLLRLVWYTWQVTADHSSQTAWTPAPRRRNARPHAAKLIVTGYVAMYRPTVPISRHVTSISLNPSRSTCLASELLQTSTWSKLSPPSYIHLAPIYFMWDRRTRATLRPMFVKRDCVEVSRTPRATHMPGIMRNGIKYAASDWWLPYFWKSFVTDVSDFLP
jgi:hypothetical protein